MVARLSAVLILILLFSRTVPAIDSPPQTVGLPLPTHIEGIEIEQIKGWFANIYPWPYLPNLSTVYPVRSLWGKPNDYQSAADIVSQNELLEHYGSGADVLEYSPNPELPAHNQWLENVLGNGQRPLYAAHEHAYGLRQIPGAA